VKEGETILQAAVRELEEEVGVKLLEEDLVYKGLLHFRFTDVPHQDLDASVFFANYDGEVVESEEMMPRWFALDDIPYPEMRPDDKIWMPDLLDEEGDVVYEFSLDAEDTLL
jgi:8-oxo-dGTP diphosphatase